MAGYISDEKITEIRERANIVDVISDYLSLKKVGNNYKGLCPFHSEKTPSFMVNEQKQIFHCFGCNTGGNVFNFIMKMDHLSFPEVVRGLAERYGVNLPDTKMSDADRRRVQKREKLLQINELAAGYFHSLLKDEKKGVGAREYLRKRGIGSEVIANHKLGYARNSWDGLLKFLGTKGVSLSMAEEVGLIVPKKSNGFYDRFRCRVVFPIIDGYNKVIGFGGRVLDDSVPKYLNSPESPVYDKSNSIYGLNIAKDFIRREGKVIIVEGYLDLLSLNQYGIRNVTATLGTSLTSGHVKVLKRYTKNVVIIFDADDAGKRAAIRSLDIFLKERISPKIGVLPSGFDPDSLVRDVGREGFEKIITDSVPIIEYIINETIKKYDSSSVEGKVNIIEELSPVLAMIENKVEKVLYIQEVGSRLGISEDSIISKLGRKKGGKIYLPREKIQFTDKSIAERLLLQIMLLRSEVIHNIREEGIIEDFTDRQYKKIGMLILDVFKKEDTLDSAEIINLLEDESSRSLVSQLLMQEESIVDAQKTMNNCVSKIRMNLVVEEIKALDQKIGKAQAEKDEALLREFLTSRQELKDRQRSYWQSLSQIQV